MIIFPLLLKNNQSLIYSKLQAMA